MTHHQHGADFLARFKSTLLEAEVLHHVALGDFDTRRLAEHVEAHGIDATEEDIRHSVDVLTEEGYLGREDGRLMATDEGAEAWRAAAGISVHLAHELRRGIDKADRSNYPVGPRE